ncbi:MAG TPA: site-specific DNA-methyltransferase [Solirubrobacteraceae bacterium]|nr:site-specific DNA-methyltransferase [Solirubrobacteraceae bacterium]
MPPRKKTAAKTPTAIESITHTDKRTNLPTVDAQDFLAPELEQPVPVRYPRDPTLDPQLVWKGKDELDGEDLVANAPPIYIQEKIDPRVLIENLRNTAAQPEEEPELTLFDNFDGLSEHDIVEFYEHDANWSNRMILGDSLNVMASLAEREALRGKMQMIYLDPPYGIKFGSNWQVSARKREVKDGKVQDATREVEQIKAFRDTWELGIHSYLAYLRDRLTVAKDLLTESGSIFVQIGDENVHLVRSLMDEVFGSENFRSLITYRTSVGLGAEGLDNVTNFLLWYSKTEAYKFRNLYRETRPGESGASRYRSLILADGSTRRANQEELEDPRQLPAGSHLYRDQGLTSRTGSKTTVFPVEFQGRTYRPTAGGWRTAESGMQRLRWADRLLPTGKTLSFRKYWDDFSALSLTNFWDDVSGGITSRSDPKIYVVQTATKIVERCLLMTTDPNDLVLDPTCGSGTTAYVAEQWGRRWITVDTSRVALALARQRLTAACFPHYLLADSLEGRARESELAGTQLPPTGNTNDIRHGFVYERMPHITLKSIANNPDIKEGMTREEIDAAIQRHADYELLYDKPYEDKRKMRVAGPFTVESLSPHRSLAFAGSAVDQTGSLNDGSVEGASHGDASFEQTILANLRTAGIQNGRKEERMRLDTIEPYAAEYIQAVGERDVTDDETAPRRVGITIGPQYGTVGPAFIKDAAREANRAGDLDLLCVLAFAFDPSVLGSTGDGYVTSDEGFANVAAERRLGRVPVLLVRMNADLVMGEELKKTGAGNLFTVFGEPDIEIERDGEDLRVILRGVDVYDPNTGEIRSNNTDQIALWMIDTAYNGESFFVRHCYFTGGQEPYRRLKGALKADIDEETWATLYRTESRSFSAPESGKIAVKVINDYGDEVLKVFEV